MLTSTVAKVVAPAGQPWSAQNLSVFVLRVVRIKRKSVVRPSRKRQPPRPFEERLTGGGLAAGAAGVVHARRRGVPTEAGVGERLGRRLFFS